MDDPEKRHPDEPDRHDSEATRTGAPSAGQSQLVGSQPVDPRQGVEEPDQDESGKRSDER